MRTKDKLLIGALAAAGTLAAARVWRRHRRCIDFKDRVVIITGATSGHGLLVARELAREGAHLVLAARTSDDLAAAEEDLNASSAASVIAVPTDTRVEDQVHSLVDIALSRHDRIDILINNAATIEVGPLEAQTIDDFREAMNSTYWGAFNTTFATLPQMRRQGFGRIGNVVSFGGKIAVPHLLPYVTGKFALAGLTQGLRAELAKSNILVTGLYPPVMRTGGHTHAFFKGNHQLEHAMFSVAATFPGLSVSASRVARKFVNAIRHGDAEVIVSWPAYLAILLQNAMPNEMAEIMGLACRFLPTFDGGPNAAVRGENIPGATAELLNRAIPREARPVVR